MICSFLITAFLLIIDTQTTLAVVDTGTAGAKCGKQKRTWGYDYNELFKFSDKSYSNGNLYLTFRVQAASDAHVILSTKPKLDCYTEIYEIVLGAGVDTFTDIRRYVWQRGPVQRASVYTDDLLSATELREFTVSIAKDGLIEIMKGSEAIPILHWKDPDPIPVSYFGFSTYASIYGIWYFDCYGKEFGQPALAKYEFFPGCGQPAVAKFRIMGGEEALPGRWPWMAAIFLHGPSSTQFLCGGSLIGDKYVLTAAHCTMDQLQRRFSASQFKVLLGDVDFNRDDEPSDPQTYNVAEVKAHSRFNAVEFYNDIAIMVLDQSVRKSKYVIPLCLPPKQLRDEAFVGQSATVVGWGTTYYDGKESTIQREAALPVWKNDDCARMTSQPITDNYICAGYKEGGKDACQGDSGGPLMLKKNGHWIQIGIVSFSFTATCGEPGNPGIYTRVTQYLDWIDYNMAMAPRPELGYSEGVGFQMRFGFNVLLG